MEAYIDHYRHEQQFSRILPMSQFVHFLIDIGDELFTFSNLLSSLLIVIQAVNNAAGIYVRCFLIAKTVIL